MRLFKHCALVITLALVGSSVAQVDVVWWDFLGGGDGVRMKAMIDQFNAEHPDINIVGTTLEWGVPYYTRVQTAVPVGEGPDIMTYHSSRMPLAVPFNLFRPISDDELASVGLSTDDYFPAVVDAVTYDGEFLCAPLDVHSHVIYYNREILDSVGLIGDDGLPTGLDGVENFTEALRLIQAETGVLPFSISTDGGSVWRFIYSLYNQQTNVPLIDGTDVNAGEELANAVSLLAGWVAEGLAPENAEYPASIALFTSGQAAMHANGVWEVPTMVDLAAAGDLFDWGAIAYPVFYDQPATWADSHCFGIPNNPRNPIGGDKLDAVLTVIAWMNQNSLAWAGAGHIPAYLPVVESADYQNLQPNATYAVLAETATFDPVSRIAGVASPLYDAIDNYLAPAMNGLLPVDEAIQMFKMDLESQF